VRVSALTHTGNRNTCLKSVVFHIDRFTFSGVDPFCLGGGEMWRRALPSVGPNFWSFTCKSV